MDDKLKLIGVEAFKLQQMQKAKIKVPPFVVLSADLFDLFFTPLKGPLFELKNREDLTNSEKSFQAQKLFWVQEVHDTVRKEIFRILKITFSPNKLLKEIWAVRPSWAGIGNDIGAGVVETPQTLQGAFLGVKGEDKIVEAIKGLWSLVLEETIFLHEDFSKLKVAVIVQEFIHAEVSGLLWTGNPIQRRPHEMLIQGHYGLGSGEELNSNHGQHEMVGCDSWRTDQNGVVQSETLSVKQNCLEWNRAKGHGVITNDVPDLLKNRPVLSAVALKDLVQLGKKIEAVFGMSAQKISWSYCEGRFWILSSATIKEFAHVKKSYPLHIWQSEGVPSGIRGVVAPLSFSLFRVFWQGLNLADLCYRQGQVFIKKNEQKNNIEKMGAIEKVLSLVVTKMRGEEIIKFIFSFLELGARHLALHQGRRLLKEIEKGKDNRENQEIQEIDLQILLKVHAHFKKGEVWQRLRESKDIYTEFIEKKLTKLNVSTELKRDILSGVTKSGRYDFLHLGLWVCGDEELYHFIKNASENEVLESLMRSRVREEWDIFRERFLSYLNIWGGYGPFEFKLEVDSYAEDAKPILLELKELLKRSAHEIQSEIEELEGRKKSLLHSLSHQLESKKIRFPVIMKKGVIFLWWLQNKEHEWQHQTVRLFAALRRSFRKLGELWVVKGLLEKDDDIFYLTVDEIMQTLQEIRYTENYFDLTMMRRLEALGVESTTKEAVTETQTHDKVETEMGTEKNTRFYSYGPYDSFWVQ